MPDIIIVEDNKEIGTLLCDFLRRENYTVSLADTGEKALSIFEQYGAKLLVLDIGLPGLDGFSVCSRIRETSNTHILIASAKTDKENTLKGLQIFGRSMENNINISLNAGYIDRKDKRYIQTQICPRGDHMQ